MAPSFTTYANALRRLAGGTTARPRTQTYRPAPGTAGQYTPGTPANFTPAPPPQPNGPGPAYTVEDRPGHYTTYNPRAKAQQQQGATDYANQAERSDLIRQGFQSHIDANYGGIHNAQGRELDETGAQLGVLRGATGVNQVGKEDDNAYRQRLLGKIQDNFRLNPQFEDKGKQAQLTALERQMRNHMTAEQQQQFDQQKEHEAALAEKALDPGKVDREAAAGQADLDRKAKQKIADDRNATDIQKATIAAGAKGKAGKATPGKPDPQVASITKFNDQQDSYNLASAEKDLSEKKAAIAKDGLNGKPLTPAEEDAFLQERKAFWETQRPKKSFPTGPTMSPPLDGQPVTEPEQVATDATPAPAPATPAPAPQAPAPAQPGLTKDGNAPEPLAMLPQQDAYAPEEPGVISRAASAVGSTIKDAAYGAIFPAVVGAREGWDSAGKAYDSVKNLVSPGTKLPFRPIDAPAPPPHIAQDLHQAIISSGATPHPQLPGVYSHPDAPGVPLTPNTEGTHLVPLTVPNFDTLGSAPTTPQEFQKQFPQPTPFPR